MLVERPTVQASEVALQELRSGGLAAGAALLREYAGADEEKKKIITEIFRRLAVDVKDELVKAAGASVRRAGESILATGQAIADLRKYIDFTAVFYMTWQ
jgi:hypothetical protein